MKRRTSSTIPFGYTLDEETNTLLPVDVELAALEETKRLVKERLFSLREGAEYLSYITGRPLSHVGLRQIIKRDERLGQ